MDLPDIRLWDYYRDDRMVILDTQGEVRMEHWRRTREGCVDCGALFCKDYPMHRVTNIDEYGNYLLGEVPRCCECFKSRKARWILGEGPGESFVRDSI